MRSRRLTILLVLAGLAVMVVLAQARRGADDAVAPAPSGVWASPSVAVSPDVSASIATTPSAGAAPAPASASDTLEAVRTLKRFCDLVDDGDRRAAGRLLAGPWVWPRRELRAIARLSLLSARAQDAPRTGDIVLMARLRARLRAASPLHDGVNTLFFTLGRAGTTGGWLVTAVTTSP
jgi:hypothetical protein